MLSHKTSHPGLSPWLPRRREEGKSLWKVSSLSVPFLCLPQAEIQTVDVTTKPAESGNSKPAIILPPHACPLMTGNDELGKQEGPAGALTSSASVQGNGGETQPGAEFLGLCALMEPEDRACSPAGQRS